MLGKQFLTWLNFRDMWATLGEEAWNLQAVIKKRLGKKIKTLAIWLKSGMCRVIFLSPLWHRGNGLCEHHSCHLCSGTVNATRNCLQFLVSSHCFSGAHPVDNGFPHTTHCSSTVSLPIHQEQQSLSPSLSWHFFHRMCPSPRLSGFLSTHFRPLVTCTETTGIHCGVYSLRFLTVVT